MGPQPPAEEAGIPQNHGFAALKKELDRSLREKWFKGRRPQTAAGAGRRCCGRCSAARVRDQLILIRGGRLFTTQNFTHNTKHTYMLRLLAAVQRAGGRCRLRLLYESSSRGKCHDLDGLGGHGRLLPTLVIAKLDGYGQCGIRYRTPTSA